MRITQAQYRLMLEIDNYDYVGKVWLDGLETRTAEILEEKRLIDILTCDDGDKILSLTKIGFKTLHPFD